jgi:hypothetical protein
MHLRSVPAAALALAALLCAAPDIAARAAEGCATAEDEISTDRPDTTNSAYVVPRGSVQLENGIDWTDDHGTRSLAGPQSKARVGIVPCTELGLQLPSYVGTLRGHGASGFSGLQPSLKHQFGELPGDLTVFAIAGVTLPTGARSVSGSHYDPFVQVPWTKELGEGWSFNGMSSVFWFPGERSVNPTFEQTLEVAWEAIPHTSVFLEYVGDYPRHQGPSQVLQLGGAYRFTRTQQLDFHLGAGLSANAPSWFFGVGYSIRFDGLF